MTEDHASNILRSEQDFKEGRSISIEDARDAALEAIRDEPTEEFDDELDLSDEVARMFQSRIVGKVEAEDGDWIYTMEMPYGLLNELGVEEGDTIRLVIDDNGRVIHEIVKWQQPEWLSPED